MRKYEIMYILDSETADTKAVIAKMESILTSNGAKIVEKEEWGIKDLAYKINHKSKGFYGVFITETSDENIVEFRRVTGIDKNVVRTLIINTESEINYIQSTKYAKTDMAKYKEERPERRFGDRKNFKKFDGNKEGWKPRGERPANTNETSATPIVENKKDVSVNNETKIEQKVEKVVDVKKTTKKDSE